MSAKKDICLTASQLSKAKEAIDILTSLTASTNKAQVTEVAVSEPGPSHSSQRSASVPSASSSTKQVIAAADKVLLALRNKPAKPATNKKRKAKEEVASLFRKKAHVVAKKCVWKHKFVCLAYHDQRKIPTTDVEKDDLLQAGLGEKEIEFDDLDVGAEDFRDLLYHHFPSLKEGGGFQFFKCVPNSRSLEQLSPTTLSSPSLLKSRVGNARTYIRPLQRDLDLSAVFELPGGPKEECLTCGNLFSIAKLSDHVASCSNKSGNSASPASVKEEVVDLTDHVEKSPKSPLSEEGDLPPFHCESNYGGEVDGIEEEMIDTAIQRSLQESDQVGTHSPLKNSILNLKKNLIEDSELRIEIRRHFVVLDAMREAHKKKFDPKKSVKVSFIGEGALDHGGPKREFFRLFAQGVSERYFQGVSGWIRFFVNDIMAVQNRDYFYLGVFLVLSVMHGGNGMPFMAQPVFDYLVSGPYTEVKVVATEIPDHMIRFIVEKMNEAENDDDVKLVFAVDEAFDALVATGYRKAVCSLGLPDCPNIIRALLDFHLMAKVKTEMDQFREGLNTFQFLDLVKANPEMWKPYFMYSGTSLTPETIKNLLTAKFSDKGSLCRPAEEQTYVYFADFLDECADGEIDCTLEDVLVFFSGANRVPPLGFDVKPTLAFVNFSTATLPTASTCDVQLRLPSVYKDYSKFKDAMILGLKGNDGFGGV